MLPKVENLISSLFSIKIDRKLSSKAFPVDDNKFLKSTVRNEVIADLKNSWSAFTNSPVAELTNSVKNTSEKLLNVFSDISTALIVIEEYVLTSINSIPDTCCDYHATRYRLMKMANLLPVATKHDMMQIALEPFFLHKLNPFLSE